MVWLIPQVVLLAAVCFVIGGVNPATLVARLMGIDLRTAGSGNPGAANAGRVLGRKWGVLVFALDVLKAYLPTLLVLRGMGTLPALVAGFAVVLGHVFSPFLGGKGGKGVAAAFGATLAIAPWVALAAVLVFALATATLSFIGEASVVTSTGLFLVGVLGAVGVLPLERAVGVWLVLLALLVLSRHRRNILAWWGRRIS